MKRAELVLATPSGIDRAVHALAAGELIGLPTETVYGLAADASNPEAVARIFSAKGRPTDHPVIVHVAADNDLSAWAAEVNEDARRLMAAFWPGPLTLIFPRAPGVLDLVTGGQSTVGIRCPSHPVAQALLKAWQGGVAAPSANRFGRISPTTAEHVRAEFPEQIALVLEGGPCEVGIESTIVDVSGGEPVVLRPGKVSRQALEAVLGKPVRLRESVSQTPRVSGALAAHYAPRTPLRLLSAEDVKPALEGARRDGVSAGVWAFQPIADAAVERAPAEPDAYAQALYATLRRLDAAGHEVLLLEAPPRTPEWAAIWDRLGRAAVGSGPDQRD